MRTVAFLLQLDLPTAARKVADDFARVARWYDDLDAHDRLEEYGLPPLGPILERHRACNPEGQFGRVDVVIRAVVQLDADVVDRMAREHAAGERLLDALINRLDESVRNRTADDLVRELI